jgi:hypothetical protein
MLIGSNDIETEIKVDHYNIVEGDQLQQYLIVQSIVLLNVFIMFIDVVIVLHKNIQSVLYHRSISWASFVEVRNS